LSQRWQWAFFLLRPEDAEGVGEEVTCGDRKVTVTGPRALLNSWLTEGGAGAGEGEIASFSWGADTEANHEAASRSDDGLWTKGVE